jgi:diaminopimelate decarboxylase
MNPLEHSAIEEFSRLGPLLCRTGLALDRDPGAYAPLVEDDLAKALALLDVPERFNGFKAADVGIDLPEARYPALLAIIERLARFDASSLMAMPGPSLAGAAVGILGTSAQQERFFGPYRQAPQFTFLAITEPSGGSDAANCATVLRRQSDHYVLNGHKILIGGAKRASVGLVFARFEDSNRRALVMVHPREAGEALAIERMATVGLAGADLTEIHIRDLAVTEDMLIGGAPSTLRDGFMAINAVFSRHRPLVAAMALGTARGLLDRMAALGAVGANFDPFALTHAALLQRMVRIGFDHVAGRTAPHQTSQFKLDAVALVDAVSAHIAHALPARELFADASLLKLIRDGRAFEYMEGSSHIHSLNAFRSYQPRH